MIHRRRLLMSGRSLDVMDLEFAYTGTWTDTQIEISGIMYRVLQLKSDGILTIDSRMIGAVPFDVWCVRQGGAGSPGSSNEQLISTNAVHVGYPGDCPGGGRPLTSYRAPSGASGSSGGWSMITNVIAKKQTYEARVESPAYLGDIISVSGTNRSGTAWFTLPASNNGSGGAGGSGAGHGYCGSCDYSYSHSAEDGKPGTLGIVVIRLPIG